VTFKVLSLFPLVQVDVFSFGIVLWEILTGEEPYANMHYGAIIGIQLTCNFFMNMFKLENVPGGLPCFYIKFDRMFFPESSILPHLFLCLLRFSFVKVDDSVTSNSIRKSKF
jgi:hypothetical protein